MASHYWSHECKNMVWLSILQIWKKIVKEEIVDEFDHMFSMKLHLVELARIKKTEVTTLF
jgi:hypothetical protein